MRFYSVRRTYVCITIYTNEDIVIRNTLYKYYEIIQINKYTYIRRINIFYTGKYTFFPEGILCFPRIITSKKFLIINKQKVLIIKMDRYMYTENGDC